MGPKISSFDQVRNIEKLDGSNYQTWKIKIIISFQKGKIMGFKYRS